MNTGTLARFGVKPESYELKCYTPFHVSPALGHGSTDKGMYV